MRVILRFSPRPGRNSGGAACGELSLDQRLDRLMNTARRTNSPAAPVAGEGFDDYEPVAMESYWEQPEAFRNPQQPVRLARLRYPLDPTPRIAILGTGWVENQQTLCFPNGWCHEMREFRAEALAGPVSALRRLANSVFNRGAYFPHLKRPIVAFTGLASSARETFSDEDRDLLWRAFHVPVFEQFLGLDRELLAAECDAHYGLHINMESVLFQRAEDGELLVTSFNNLSSPIPKLATGLFGELMFDPCPCGKPGPRISAVRLRSAAIGSAGRARAAMLG